jgi:N-acetyl sugar amidotransferase
MDTTDPDISFDDAGSCCYCLKMKEFLKTWRPSGDKMALDQLMERIKREGRGKPYDAIMGLSGGVDSSYVALVAKEYGLRTLVIHVDTGWNSELAVKNIENTVSRLGFDLVTEVVDWEEMRQIQLAFLRSGVPNQDIPQDHAINTGFFRFAARNRIKWSLSGSNLACEGILPESWGYDAMDLRHINDIVRRFSDLKMRTFPRMSFFEFGIRYKLLGGLNVAKILNLLPYSKEAAIKELAEKLDWRYYGGKHYESRFTKWFQGWYLPSKWGYDKRVAHLSSLIASGQLTREAALLEMAKPSLEQSDFASDRDYMSRKLGISQSEFEELMRVPNTPHSAYAMTPKWQRKVLGVGAKVTNWLRGLR